MAKEKREKRTWLSIRKAKNGYTLQENNAYGATGDQEIFSTFADLVVAVGENFSEEDFAATVHQSSAMTKALQDICTTAIAPKLLAIEAKVNPGVENVVGFGDDL